MEKSLNGHTLVWAHRGASVYAPENTLPAFAVAAGMGADGIELDVHLTKDGAPLVCHNFNVEGTSDGKGEICELTLAEIKKFNFAYRWQDTKFTDKYGFVPAPTLDEVYELLAPLGLTVNVEIKSHEEELLRLCDELAEKYNMKDKVTYSSFNHQALMRMHGYDPSAPTAPLYAQQILYPWIYANLIGAMAIHPDWGQVFSIPEMVHECHIRGIRVNPWTVDGEDAMHRLCEAGVDALITDLPDVALEIVKQYK